MAADQDAVAYNVSNVGVGASAEWSVATAGSFENVGVEQPPQEKYSRPQVGWGACITPALEKVYFPVNTFASVMSLSNISQNQVETQDAVFYTVTEVT